MMGLKCRGYVAGQVLPFFRLVDSFSLIEMLRGRVSSVMLLRAMTFQLGIGRSYDPIVVLMDIVVPDFPLHHVGPPGLLMALISFELVQALLFVLLPFVGDVLAQLDLQPVQLILIQVDLIEWFLTIAKYLQQFYEFGWGLKSRQLVLPEKLFYFVPYEQLILFHYFYVRGVVRGHKSIAFMISRSLRIFSFLPRGDDTCIVFIINGYFIISFIIIFIPSICILFAFIVLSNQHQLHTFVFAEKYKICHILGDVIK